MTARRFTLKDLGVNEWTAWSGAGLRLQWGWGGAIWFLQPLLAYVSQASLVTSRKGCNRATAALFTRRSTGPTLLRACSVASQSARSTHTGSTPGHCVIGEKARLCAIVSCNCVLRWRCLPLPAEERQSGKTGPGKELSTEGSRVPAAAANCERHSTRPLPPPPPPSSSLLLGSAFLDPGLLSQPFLPNSGSQGILMDPRLTAQGLWPRKGTPGTGPAMKSTLRLPQRPPPHLWTQCLPRGPGRPGPLASDSPPQPVHQPPSTPAQCCARCLRQARISAGTPFSNQPDPDSATRPPPHLCPRR